MLGARQLRQVQHRRHALHERMIPDGTQQQRAHQDEDGTQLTGASGVQVGGARSVDVVVVDEDE